MSTEQAPGKSQVDANRVAPVLVAEPGKPSASAVVTTAGYMYSGGGKVGGP